MTIQNNTSLEVVTPQKSCLRGVQEVLCTISCFTLFAKNLEEDQQMRSVYSKGKGLITATLLKWTLSQQLFNYITTVSFRIHYIALQYHQHVKSVRIHIRRKNADQNNSDYGHFLSSASASIWGLFNCLQSRNLFISSITSRNDSFTFFLGHIFNEILSSQLKAKILQYIQCT